MQEKAWGNEYRTTMVCVDEYGSGNFSGWLHNVYREDVVSFAGVLEFLEYMEDLLDDMQFPQSFTAARSFCQTPPPVRSGLPQPEKISGKLATFAVQVLFRRNTSWQGSVTWLEGGRQQSFRSAMELLLMMDGALSSGRK